MMLYLDDDSAEALLVRLLVRAGHDVETPADASLSGGKDPAHFLYALRTGRTLITQNYEDFKLLHQLILQAGGHHPGALVVRRDNDPSRDLKPSGIVRALRKLITAAIPINDELHVLNHWR